jgi:galactokinase
MPSSTPPSFVSPGEPEQVVEELAAQFTRRTGRQPSAVVAAPGRVNLIGEHLDYNGGRCLPLALPHATYAAVAPRADRTLSVSSEQMGKTAEIALDELRPGAVTGWAAYVAGVVWALREDGWDLPGLDLTVDSRVPIAAGLSSSAALECAVALGLLSVVGATDTEQLRRRLVELCVRAEAEMAGAPTGGMDQSVALLARAGHALLLDFEDGVSHALTDGGYATRRADCEAAARTLGVRTLREARDHANPLGSLTDSRVRRRVRHVLTEMDRVDAAVEALDRGDHAALGPLLDASHDSLRDDYEVSCPELDVVVETCRRHGALGARMTGGGFGGSALALLPEGGVRQAAVAVAAAFEAHDWHPPAFLLAPAEAGARRLR